jgi:hypothetical protein
MPSFDRTFFQRSHDQPSIKHHTVFGVCQNIGNFFSELYLADVKIGGILHGCRADQLNRSSFCLSPDDNRLLRLPGLVDKILRPLRLLLRDLLLLNSRNILLAKIKLLDGDIGDIDIEIPRPLLQRRLDPIRDLVPLGQQLGGRILCDHTSHDLVDERRDDLVVVVLA